jgi:SAM-dependent methyltransferase
VPPNCRWLDIGAGTKIHDGWLEPTQDELASRAQLLIGCDVMAEHLRSNSFLTAAVSADAETLPFAAGSFDIVTANMVLEHLEHPRRVFQEIARVLAPGGRFVFVTPNHWNPVIRLASIALSRHVRKLVAPFLDGRAAEHVFITYYRANTTAAIQSHIAELPLRLERLDHFSTVPFLVSPWPATLVEAVWIRLIGARIFRGLRTNLFGELQRTVEEQAE